MGKIKVEKVGDGYQTKGKYVYFSRRFNRSITIEDGFYSDGATWAIDIKSDAWVVHDHICRFGVWDDGTKIDNFTASTILRDILWSEKYWFRSVYWWFATFLFGGGAARKNGLIRIKKNG